MSGVTVRALTGAIACCCALAVGAAGAHARGLETVMQDDGLLLHQPADQVGKALDQMKAEGVDRVRLTANWSALTRDADSKQPPTGFNDADPAAYQQSRWLALDTAVRLAAQRGIGVLVDIGFWAPVWAADDPTGPRARTNINATAYAHFAQAVAKRYSGSFAPPADTAAAPSGDEAFLDELFGRQAAPVVTTPAAPTLPAVDQLAIYNEPNQPGLLLPQWTDATKRAQPASPDVYRAMVQQAYPAIKAVRPQDTVLIGNTSSIGGTVGKGAVAPMAFIRSLACVDKKLRPIATGACASFQPVPGDGWAHHPYPLNVSPGKVSRGAKADDARVADLGRLAALLDRLSATGRISGADRQIHVTEFGYETAKVGKRNGVSQNTQARWLTWGEYEASKVPNVVSWAQFLLRDQPKATEQISASSSRPFGQYFTGLFTTAGKPKLAARTFTAGLFAQTISRGSVRLWGRLRLGTASRVVTLQRRAPHGKWATIVTTDAHHKHRASRFRAGGGDAFSRIGPAGPSGSRYRLSVKRPDRSNAAGLPVPATAADR